MKRILGKKSLTCIGCGVGGKNHKLCDHKSYAGQSPLDLVISRDRKLSHLHLLTSPTEPYLKDLSHIFPLHQL